MVDIIFTPIISSGTHPGMMQFKIRCTDVVLLEDVKKMFVDMLTRKDFDMDIQTGLHETNKYDKE
jgi:hypothetical protein